MSPIEIRLDPKLVETLLETISPVLEQLENELAAPVVLPEEDEVLEDFWKNDLLKSQREELTVISRLFDESFMETGRALIQPDEMDRVIRSCSAIRLRLREAVLGGLSDEALEEGNLDGVDWTESLQIGYAAYSLFASLQELIVSQLSGESEPSDLEEDEEGEHE
ncbi:hypothetical protein [Pelagicoccus sp. SDUM812003]|uniref:hypothetical protein n=1 Tax=Pelagicoccus sp. SDUM812003 TaxID=3041267 RepID=UPI00280EEDC9|nr:hypothetical protein [Pelagicoccus sp. SDUM812003]MDQ8205567.1 hypothetical protein [Pelagicoccus sp. SDUM812003]